MLDQSVIPASMPDRSSVNHRDNFDKTESLVFTRILVLRKRGITLSTPLCYGMLRKARRSAIPSGFLGCKAAKLRPSTGLRLRRELSRADANLLVLALVGKHQEKLWGLAPPPLSLPSRSECHPAQAHPV